MVANPARKQTVRRLTAKEERFAVAVAGGANYADAWRSAYGKPGVAYGKQNGFRTAQRPHVQARIEELRRPDEKRLFLSRARKRELLYQMAEDARALKIDRQRAIDLDNKMDGTYAQIVRIEGEITLSTVLRAMAEAPALPTSEEVIELGGPLREIRDPAADDNSAALVETPSPDTLPIKREKPARSDSAPAADLDPIEATAAGEPGKVKGPFDDDLADLLAPLPVEPRPGRVRTYEE